MTLRRRAALEAVAGTAVGLGVAFAMNVAVFRAMGLPVSLGESGWIAALFTAVSLARGYVVRRTFQVIWSEK